MPLKRPDPRVQLTWLSLALLAALVAAGVSAVLFSLSFIPRWVGRAFTGAWAALLLLTAAVYLPLRYRRARYDVSDDAVTVISGVYFINRRTMPLAGVRHITVIRGPLERLFGLAFVVFSAAGGWLLLEGVPAEDAENWSRRLLEARGGNR